MLNDANVLSSKMYQVWIDLFNCEINTMSHRVRWIFNELHVSNYEFVLNAYNCYMKLMRLTEGIQYSVLRFHI